MDSATTSQMEVFMNRFTVIAQTESEPTNEGTENELSDSEDVSDEDMMNEQVSSDLMMVIVAFGAFAVLCCLCGVVLVAVMRRNLYSKVNQMKSDMRTSTAMEMGNVDIAEDGETQLEKETEKFWE